MASQRSLCETALHPPRRLVQPNSEARTVQITGGDGAVLKAWLFRPRCSNRSAVMILHGIADSRGSQAGLARMFVNHGYVALVPDSRANGESGGELETYGILEADDVHRWVSWLIDREHPQRVFGFGESLGAAILIESLPAEPRFSGIVAESAFSSLGRIARDRVAQKLPVPSPISRLPATPVVSSAFIYARWQYGLNFWAASPESAIARSNTPMLLIHGLADQNIPPEHSRILAAANCRSTTLWLVPGAGHTGAYGAAPENLKTES